MQHCDLVLIEGFKGGDFPKLEVWRASEGKPTLWPDWPGIVAIASDVAPVAQALDVTQLELADSAAIASFVQSHAVAR
jgi:molybdopterin-guanine dinucleotide biosynthesis protein B